ncbi:MAG: glycosyltransferase family 39 protein, partial [Anaerolineae bacterium]|nr:glycosyltransferase family 39 protein [Anaerolineae bacterium]
VGLSLVLGALAFPGFSGNRFRALPTLAWLMALACLYLAFAEWAGRRGEATGEATPAAGGEGRALPHGVHLSWEVLLVLGIVLVGAFLRLYRLDAIPREMGVDMPLKYENAREIMQGQFMIFCPRYPGRESLLFYLVALYGKLFGLGHFAIKFTTAFIGVVTIPVLYVLARYLYGREVAVVAAALLAVSKWHVILSRCGYRSILVPLFVALVMLASARALRRASGTGFVVTGVVLGLGMYTYNSFLVVPPALAVLLAVEMARSGRGCLRRYGWGLIGLALAAALLCLPLGRYVLEEPRTYAFRVATRLTGAEVPLPAEPLQVLVGNLWRAAGMFNLRGDGVSYVNVPHQRHLGALSAAFFVSGLAYTLVRWRRGHGAMVLGFLGAMVLPSALAVAFPREVPSAGRASGAITSAYLLAGLPLVVLWRLVPLRALDPAQRRLRALWASQGWGRRLLPAGIVPGLALTALLGLELRETWQAYFRDYVRHLPGGNYAISLEIARVLDEFEGEGESYVMVWPHWFDGNALRAQLMVKSTSWDWELPRLDPAEPPLSTARGKVLFVVHPSDEATLRMLQECFPRGVAISHRDNNGQVAFVTFYGER